jgi:hypothetical protein
MIVLASSLAGRPGDAMRLVPLLALAVSALAPAFAASFPPPDLTGLVMLRYQPIMCVKAPCPAGTYQIEQDGKAVATVAHLKMDPATDDALERVIAANPLSDALAIEGTVWIDRAGSTATILAQRAIPGEWKPAVPVAAHTLEIVNRTGDVIRGIYLAPARADHWGAEQAGENVQAGAGVTLTLPTADCLYDIRILLAERPAEEIRQQDVCRDGKLTADRSGTIIRRGE